MLTPPKTKSCLVKESIPRKSATYYSWNWRLVITLCYFHPMIHINQQHYTIILCYDQVASFKPPEVWKLISPVWRTEDHNLPDLLRRWFPLRGGNNFLGEGWNGSVKIDEMYKTYGSTHTQDKGIDKKLMKPTQQVDVFVWYFFWRTWRQSK